MQELFHFHFSHSFCIHERPATAPSFKKISFELKFRQFLLSSEVFYSSKSSENPLLIRIFLRTPEFMQFSPCTVPTKPSTHLGSAIKPHFYVFHISKKKFFRFFFTIFNRVVHYPKWRHKTWQPKVNVYLFRIHTLSCFPSKWLCWNGKNEVRSFFCFV